jgi:hypothetical protein
VRVAFFRVSWTTDGQRSVRRRRWALLDHVCQLVRQEGVRRRQSWRVLPWTEDHVRADRVGSCIDGVRGLARLSIGVDSDLAEVMPEPRLHRRTRGCVQLLTGRADHLAHAGWRNGSEKKPWQKLGQRTDGLLRFRRRNEFTGIEPR